MVKLVVLGDVHGEFWSIDSIYEKEKPYAFLQVGDLADQVKGERRFNVGGYPEHLPCPFYWILGNHEKLVGNDENPKTYKTVGNPLGFYGSVKIDNYQILGIGGIDGKRRDVHWGVTGALDKAQDFRFSKKYFGILMTHETCSPFIHTVYKRELGNPRLTELCTKKLRPTIHVSGHFHHHDESVIDGIRHYRLPRSEHGYLVIEDERIEYRPTPIC
ncbi:MAG TPA: metallophosphoesterase [archaeon]|nr:metallophosphoesterase [archaeon]